MPENSAGKSWSQPVTHRNEFIFRSKGVPWERFVCLCTESICSHALIVLQHPLFFNNGASSDRDFPWLATSAAPRQRPAFSRRLTIPNFNIKKATYFMQMVVNPQRREMNISISETLRSHLL